MRSRSYSPSGGLGLSVLPMTLLTALAAAVLAGLYELLVHWIPFIYLDALLVFGFAVGVAAAGGEVIKRGHCRNPPLALILAVMLGATAVVSSHLWSYRRGLASVRDELPELTWSELIERFPLSAWLQLRVESGWRMKSSTFNGALVWVIWGIEAAVVLGAIAYLMWKQARAPYCERCRQWMAEEKTALPGITEADVEASVRSADWSSVLALSVPQNADGTQLLRLTRAACTTCSDTSYLSVDAVVVITKKDGKTDTKETSLVTWAALSPEQHALFSKRFSAQEAGALQTAP